MAKKASSSKSRPRGSKTSARSAAKRSTRAGAGKSAKKTAKKTPRKTAKKTSKKSPKRTAKNPKAAKRVKGKVKSLPSKVHRKQFRQMLLDKRRDLIGDMSGIEAEALRKNRQDGTGDLSNLPTHPADIGTDNYEQEFTLGLLESERALLEEIDNALERIKNGTFGICLGTGEAIGLPRLKARPWAKYCIEYARMLEKGLVKRDEDREAEIAGLSEEDEDSGPSKDDED